METASHPPPQPDLSCESTLAPGNNGGYNCRGSELGHLFNAAAPSGLGNPNFAGTGTGLDGSTGTVGTGCNPCFTNTGPFDITNEIVFWSGSEYAPFPSFAWAFRFTSGRQLDRVKRNGWAVWPVRSGLSVVAPPDTPEQIPTLSLWGLGLMSFLLAFVARRKAR